MNEGLRNDTHFFIDQARSNMAASLRSSQAHQNSLPAFQCVPHGKIQWTRVFRGHVLRLSSNIGCIYKYMATYPSSFDCKESLETFRHSADRPTPPAKAACRKSGTSWSRTKSSAVHPRAFCRSSLAPLAMREAAASYWEEIKANLRWSEMVIQLRGTRNMCWLGKKLELHVTVYKTSKQTARIKKMQEESRAQHTKGFEANPSGTSKEWHLQRGTLAWSLCWHCHIGAAELSTCKGLEEPLCVEANRSSGHSHRLSGQANDGPLRNCLPWQALPNAKSERDLWHRLAHTRLCYLCYPISTLLLYTCFYVDHIPRVIFRFHISCCFIP